MITWDIEEDFDGYMPTRGRKPTGKVMQALITLHGRLEDTRIIDGRHVVYRIALPEGSDTEFTKLAGYILSQPREDF